MISRNNGLGIVGVTPKSYGGGGNNGKGFS